MSGGCRATADLFFYLSPKRLSSKWARKWLFKDLIRCLKRKDMWRDTFGRFQCLLIGHRKRLIPGECSGEDFIYCPQCRKIFKK